MRQTQAIINESSWIGSWTAATATTRTSIQIEVNTTIREVSDGDGRRWRPDNKRERGPETRGAKRFIIAYLNSTPALNGASSQLGMQQACREARSAPPLPPPLPWSRMFLLATNISASIVVAMPLGQWWSFAERPFAVGPTNCGDGKPFRMLLVRAPPLEARMD